MRRGSGDLRRNGYNDGVQLRERVVLPRVKDLVEDVCDLKRCAGSSEGCWGMDADFEDALLTMHVDPSEWRYLVAEMVRRVTESEQRGPTRIRILLAHRWKGGAFLFRAMQLQRSTGVTPGRQRAHKS